MHSFSCFFIGMTIISTLIHLPSFANYKRIYQTLPFLEFYKDDRVVWAIKKDKKDVLLWSFKKNSFHLGGGTILTNTIATCFCPYSFYWLIKYQRWFKKNINISELKKFEDR